MKKSYDLRQLEWQKKSIIEKNLDRKLSQNLRKLKHLRVEIMEKEERREIHSYWKLEQAYKHDCQY